MNYLPLVLFVLVVVALLAFSARARRRQAVDQAAREERIGVGSEIMTTSGLHGTVVAKNDDGSVKMSIAPGVEVTWEFAALRDRASLPARYQRDLPPTAGDADESERVELDKQRRPDDA